MARWHLESHLSGEELGLDEVWDWYEFQDTLIGEERLRALDALLPGAAPGHPRYFGKAYDELIEFFDAQREGLRGAAMLDLLAATEAALRVDYIVRVRNKKKDEISKAFAALYKEHEQKVSLEDQILEVWKQHSAPETRRAIGEFNGALNLRHWLAHGRYWRPKLGRAYDPPDVYGVCGTLLEATLHA